MTSNKTTCVWNTHSHLTSISELTDRLGPTDPCSTAVHMEPFSTSVYKVLTCILATTTKICSCGRSTPTHVECFVATTVTSLLSIVYRKTDYNAGAV